MRLYLDQGNTRLKWALESPEGALLPGGVLEGPDALPELALAVFRSGSPDLVAISCVAGGEVLERLLQIASALWNSQIVKMRSLREVYGLRNGYADPDSLGVDRWLAMLGARSAIPGAAIVVDAGTALTIDAVDGCGRHLGGYIVPGYELQCRALTRAAACVVGPSSRREEQGWGRDTGGAVGRGVRLQLGSFVDRTVVELTACVADTCTLVMTGGDAHFLAPVIRSPLLIDDALVFKGMRMQLSHLLGDPAIASRNI